MIKGRTLIAVGLGLFVVFLVALLPARLAFGWFAPPGVSLGGVTGTVWNGSAAQLGVNGRLIGRLRWSDGSLLALIGRPGWDIELDRNDGFLRGRVRLGLGGDVTGRDLEGATSLTALRGIAPVGNAQGDISIRLDELALAAGQLETIRGRVVIDRLRPPGLREGDLGTIAVRFPDESDPPLTGYIEVEGGPITVRDALIRIEPDGSYEIGGRVAAAPGAPRDITDALQYMGSADPDGFHEFSLAGSP